jgi:hypothetical protein
MSPQYYRVILESIQLQNSHIKIVSYRALVAVSVARTRGIMDPAVKPRGDKCVYEFAKICSYFIVELSTVYKVSPLSFSPKVPASLG